MGVFEHWPNRITAVRFVGALVLFAIFAVYGELDPASIRQVWCIAFWLFTVTAATDFLDGYLARQGNQVTAFGRIADPFVDKVLILGSMIFLAVLDWSQPYLPAWMVVVILSRELLVTGIRGYVEKVGGEFPADGFGKIKMIVQCIAVGALLWLEAYAWPAGWLVFWQWTAHVFVWATLVATVGSGISYVSKTSNILREVGA
ncbi:MAG: CDP-diacylglycerol--glycerol-3-phosphate 3-phosphatidyltransferase [Chlamydiales bacterium]|jgi:CDP-diacylglycerol--glycerol-3-phosphate 3-phosphatidyltransferase